MESMKAGPFNKLISEVLGPAEKTVVVFHRALKEADLLTSGSRGAGAPEMTAKDCAVSCLSFLVTEKPAEAVKKVSFYGNWQMRQDDEMWPLDEDEIAERSEVCEILQLSEDHTLLEAMEAIFILFSDEDRWGPHTIKMSGKIKELQELMPVVSFKYDETTKSVTMRFNKLEAIYQDEKFHAFERSEMMRRGNENLAVKDPEAYCASLDAVRAMEAERGLDRFSGLRITREIASPEIQKIANAVLMGG